MQAQTTNGPTSLKPVTNSIVGSALSIGQDIASFFADDTSFLSTNTQAVLGAGPVINGKNAGGELDLEFPVTSQLSIGAGVMYLHQAKNVENWSINLINAQVGKTLTTNLFGNPLYAFVYSGPNINLRNVGAIGAASFTGVRYGLKLKKLDIELEGSAGNVTGYPGVVLKAMAKVGFKF